VQGLLTLRGPVILPYAEGFSKIVAKVLEGFNIKVSHTPMRTIAHIFKKPLDKISKEASSVQDQNVEISLVKTLVRSHVH